jgi:hypothetical protein
MLETSTATVQRVREHFFRQGLDAALERSAPDRVYERSFDGRAEARLIALAWLACSQAPKGRERWSMRLLADKAVQMGIVQGVCHETLTKALKKRTAPSAAEGLGDPAPTERPVPLEDGRGLGPLRGALRRKAPGSLLRGAPLPAAGRSARAARRPSGSRPERRDHEYIRRGDGAWLTSWWPTNPLRAGGAWRLASVGADAGSPSSLATWRRISTPEAEKIRLVVDNLNIHTPASFYEVFDAEQARRLSRRR